MQCDQLDCFTSASWPEISGRKSNCRDPSEELALQLQDTMDGLTGDPPRRQSCPEYGVHAYLRLLPLQVKAIFSLESERGLTCCVQSISSPTPFFPFLFICWFLIFIFPYCLPACVHDLSSVDAH